MAWKPPGAHELRTKVRFQRRASGGNVGGEVKTVWENICDRSARLMPTRGGEETMADRAAGVALFDLVVRFDGSTRTITTDHRLVVVEANGADGRAFAINWAEDLEARKRWIVMQLTSGQGDGR